MVPELNSLATSAAAFALAFGVASVRTDSARSKAISAEFRLVLDISNHSLARYPVRRAMLAPIG
jgi:hypothetical protein